MDHARPLLTFRRTQLLISGAVLLPGGLEEAQGGCLGCLEAVALRAALLNQDLSRWNLRPRSFPQAALQQADREGLEDLPAEEAEPKKKKVEIRITMFSPPRHFLWQGGRDFHLAEVADLESSEVTLKRAGRCSFATQRRGERG